MSKQNENRPGYKKTKVGWIPEEWEVKLLGSFGSFSKGKGIANSEKKEKGLPCITYGEIYTTHNYAIKKFSSFIDRETAKKSQRIKRNDMLFAGSGETLDEIGKCVAYTKNVEAYAGGDIVIFSPRNVDCIYLSYSLNSDLITRQRRKLGQGHSVVHIYSSGLKKLHVPLPPLQEQKKIAEILSAWDRAIELIGKLVDTKTKLKKALMQKLLIGKQRFKEFIKTSKKQDTRYGVIPYDWGYPKVGEIAEELSNRNPKNKNIPVLSCTKYDGLVESLKYFGRQIFSKDTSIYKVVKRGQFAYATNHIEEGSIGMLNFLDKGLVSPMYTVFKTGDRVYAPFLYKIFKTELYRHIFEVNTSASVNRRGSLRWHKFALIHVPLPHIYEQKKISDCIDSINKEIKLIEKKVETLKQKKKGLMQKLLTGQVRVRV